MFSMKPVWTCRFEPDCYRFR